MTMSILRFNFAAPQEDPAERKQAQPNSNQRDEVIGRETKICGANGHFLP